MSGLEKIIQQILDDNAVECQQIINRAQAEADEIIKHAKTSAAQQKQDTIKAVELKCKKDAALAASRAEHELKKRLLSVRINIINQTIQNALESLINLPDAEYFSAIKKLVFKYAQKGSGSLRFSRHDLNRLPADFELLLNRELSQAEALIKISNEPINCSGGFILSYENIQQNCTFDALLSSFADEIKDTLYAEIFAGEAQ